MKVNGRIIFFFSAFLGCLYTYSLDNNETVKEFISPKFFDQGLPHAQKCMWRFVVPEKKKLHIAFHEANLEGDDIIAIHNGWNSEGASIGAITNKKPPEAGGYSSQNNVVSLEFESKSSNPSRKRSKGFRGTFKVTDSKGKKIIEWFP